MKYLKITAVLASLGIGFFCYQWAAAAPASNTNQVDYGESVEHEGYTIVSAAESANLQVFLINGEDALGSKRYTTLATAMENDLVTVKETGSVNELSIDNKSDEYIFIHSGDIVKGGKQDRTLAYDVIIPPNSKGTSLESYCVESGRWQARENEDVGEFSTTKNMLSSRELKMAAKYDNNQSKVWQTVTEEQNKLSANVSKINGYDLDVSSDLSSTSLQLTLESEELEKAKKEMETNLTDLLRDNPDAIGYAYAINGEVYGIDIYNNRALFSEIWGKIVTSIVVEAISNQTEESYERASINNVVAFMDALKGSTNKPNSKHINKTTDFTTLENEAGNVIFSTVDKDAEQWLHKNYMKADKSAPKKNIEQNGLYNFNEQIQN